MAVEEGFLQAILKAPDDDAPRLIYADWLEERGDPRGEFIRIQCELARMSEGGQYRAALVEREKKLLAENEEEWLGPLRRLGLERRGSNHEFAEFTDASTLSCVDYRRGFVECVCLEVEAFLQRAESLFQAAPLLRHVRLMGIGMLYDELPANGGAPLGRHV